jgi:hypothetical protein
VWRRNRPVDGAPNPADPEFARRSQLLIVCF